VRVTTHALCACIHRVDIQLGGKIEGDAAGTGESGENDKGSTFRENVHLAGQVD